MQPWKAWWSLLFLQQLHLHKFFHKVKAL
jgi:hypothetical protein